MTVYKGLRLSMACTLSPIVQSVRIFGFHPEDPGSIPGGGVTFYSFFAIIKFTSDLESAVMAHRLRSLNVEEIISKVIV